MDLSNGFEALVDEGVSHVCSHIVSLFNHDLQGLVHFATSLGVVLTEVGKDLQELRLNPWTGHPVVVEVSRKSVVDDLL